MWFHTTRSTRKNDTCHFPLRREQPVALVFSPGCDSNSEALVLMFFSSKQAVSKEGHVSHSHWQGGVYHASKAPTQSFTDEMRLEMKPFSIDFLLFQRSAIERKARVPFPLAGSSLLCEQGRDPVLHGRDAARNETLWHRCGAHTTWSNQEQSWEDQRRSHAFQ
jgi:hypothetical protein